MNAREVIEKALDNLDGNDDDRWHPDFILAALEEAGLMVVSRSLVEAARSLMETWASDDGYDTDWMPATCWEPLRAELAQLERGTT